MDKDSLSMIRLSGELARIFIFETVQLLDSSKRG
jgi:hypothetical protein